MHIPFSISFFLFHFGVVLVGQCLGHLEFKLAQFLLHLIALTTCICKLNHPYTKFLPQMNIFFPIKEQFEYT